MKTTLRPIFITVSYGLLCGISFIPISMALSHILYWPAAFRLTIWAFLALYLFMLTRWAKASPLSILFPLLLLLILIFWGNSESSFLLLAIGVLSWVRSGVCFQGGILKTFGAEIVLCLGGGAIVSYFAPHSMVTWALGIWMFFLVQSLYFALFRDLAEQEEEVEVDAFDRARNQAERILSTHL